MDSLLITWGRLVGPRLQAVGSATGAADWVAHRPDIYSPRAAAAAFVRCWAPPSPKPPPVVHVRHTLSQRAGLRFQVLIAKTFVHLSPVSGWSIPFLLACVYACLPALFCNNSFLHYLLLLTMWSLRSVRRYSLALRVFKKETKLLPSIPNRVWLSGADRVQIVVFTRGDSRFPASWGRPVFLLENSICAWKIGCCSQLWWPK